MKRTAFILCVLLACAGSASARQAGEEAYIAWLEKRSMLYQGDDLAETVSGKRAQWEHPFGRPQTREFVETAPVWLSAYPPATITSRDDTVLQALGDEKLWNLLKDIGVRAMHTGPVKLAGGITGKRHTPTVDGWFDRISLDIDPLFGDERQYLELVRTSGGNGAIIVGDVIPGHTGKGYDFRLAERAYKDYPGIYSMVEIEPADWGVLPEVSGEEDSVNLTAEQVGRLAKEGYIPGHLQRVMFSVPGGAPVTGWDATPEIEGVDGITRRWVYLHYFRPGQPTLNWLDPSFAASRLIAGDIVRTRDVLGAKAIRLDANPFLGIEPAEDGRAWSEGHPLSVVASDNIAFLIRKLGGWSFQELNLGLGDIKKFSENGPDLSYDFITRPAYAHALLTGDASFLRLCIKLMKKYGIEPIQLIHALQNHDEITYELVHLSEHADEMFELGGEEISGKDLREKIVRQMRSMAAGDAAPYNRLSGNGLCTTYAGFCAAAFGIKDPYNMTDKQVERVKRGHLLLAMYNAMQPGVFALSGWDLVGALPVKTGKIPGLLKDGDYRWINRGAYDLTGEAPGTNVSVTGMPRAAAVYGDLSSQLNDPGSFASRVKKMLEIRRKYGIHLSRLVGIPGCDFPGTLILLLELPGDRGLAVTALNFGRTPVKESISLNALKGKYVTDILSGNREGKVPDSGNYQIELEPVEGKVLLFSDKGFNF